jgi:hypothetical protein
MTCCCDVHAADAAEPFQLEEWLLRAGVASSKVPATAECLRQNDFDTLALLRKSTPEELKECGITSVGIRKCIMEALRQGRSPDDGGSVGCLSTYRVEARQ